MTEENGYATPWKPAPGDVITGKVVEAGMIDPNGKGRYLRVTLENAEGQFALHCFHSVLKNEIARARPKVGPDGDEITVTYNGKKEGGAYGEYNSYSVSGGQVREMDWDSLLPQDEQQGSSVPIPPAPVPAAPVASPSAPSAAEKFGNDLPF